MKCGVWSVKCGVWSVKCEVHNGTVYMDVLVYGTKLDYND